MDFPVSEEGSSKNEDSSVHSEASSSQQEPRDQNSGSSDSQHEQSVSSGYLHDNEEEEEEEVEDEEQRGDEEDNHTPTDEPTASSEYNEARMETSSGDEEAEDEEDYVDFPSTPETDSNDVGANVEEEVQALVNAVSQTANDGAAVHDQSHENALNENEELEFPPTPPSTAEEEETEDEQAVVVKQEPSYDQDGKDVVPGMGLNYLPFPKDTTSSGGNAGGDVTTKDPMLASDGEASLPAAPSTGGVAEGHPPVLEEDNEDEDEGMIGTEQAKSAIASFIRSLRDDIANTVITESAVQVQHIFDQLTRAQAREVRALQADKAALQGRVEESVTLVSELTSRLGEVLRDTREKETNMRKTRQERRQQLMEQQQQQQQQEGRLSSSTNLVQSNRCSELFLTLHDCYDELAEPSAGDTTTLYTVSDGGVNTTSRSSSNTLEQRQNLLLQLRDEVQRCVDTSNGANSNETVITTMIGDLLYSQQHVKILEHEASAWRETYSKLIDTLRTVTEENGKLRRELLTTRGLSVPLDQYDVVVQERDALRSQLTELRGQVDILREQLAADPFTSGVVGGEAAQGDENEEGARDFTAKIESFSSALQQQRPQEPVAAGEESVYHQRSEWAAAHAELERIAVEYARQQDLVPVVAGLQAEVASLTDERQTLRDRLAELEAEDQAIRLDAQAMTYHKHVQAQQIVSLLGRVERLQQRLRRVVAGGANTKGANSNDGEANEREDNGDDGGEDESRNHRKKKSKGGPVAAGRSLVHSFVSDRRRENVRAMGESVELLSRRSTTLRDTANLLVQSPRESRLGVNSNSNRTSKYGMVGANSYEDSHSHAGEGDSARMLVTKGLRRNLAAYTRHSVDSPGDESRQTRTVNLRRLGGPVTLESPMMMPYPSPRLPACDQLSGIAISRPTPYVAVDAQPAGAQPFDSGESFLGLTAGSEMRDVLEMISMLEEGESLDEHSVGSIADLVKRNEELVQQLYTTTQELEAARCAAGVGAPAATSSPSLARPRAPGVSRDSGSGSVGQGKHVRFSDTPAEHPHSIVLSVEDSAAAAADGKRPREESNPDNAEDDYKDHSSDDDEPIAEPLGADEVVLHQRAAKRYCGEASRFSATDRRTLCNLVRQQTEAIAGYYEAQLTEADCTLTEALLRVLRLTRGARADGEDRADSDSTPEATTRSVGDFLQTGVLVQLLDYCAQVSSSLAQREESMARTYVQEMSAVHTSVWQRAQQVLSDTVGSLRDTFLRQCESKVPATVLLAAPSAPSLTTAAAVNSSAMDTEAQMLEQMISLLGTAATKEETIARVYASAKRRQVQYMQLKEKQLLEQQQRLSQDQLLHDSAQQQQQQQWMEGSPLHRPGALGSSSASIQPSPALDPLRLPPTISHPLTPPALPSATAATGEPSADAIAIAAYEASCLPAGGRRLDSLQQQLQLAQAAHAGAVQELHAERQRHADLCERMWQLELERDEAVAARRAAEEAAGKMVARDVYEALIQELDEAREGAAAAQSAIERGAAEREALAARCEEKEKRLIETDFRTERIIQQLNDEVRAREAAKAESARERQELLATADDLRGSLRAAQAAEERAVVNLRAAEERERALRAELARVRSDFLASADALGLFEVLFPRDRDAVRLLQAEIASLCEQRVEWVAAATELKLRCHQGEAALAAAESSRRTEEAARQAAEALVQHTRAELVEAQNALRSSTNSNANNNNNNSSAAADEEKRQLVIERDGLLESVRQLRETETLWQKREAEMRDRIDVLSRDPISECARRYGLRACRTFEEQMEALHASQASLRDARAAAEEEARNTRQTLAAVQAALAETQSQLAECREDLDRVQREKDELATTGERLSRVVGDWETRGAALAAELAERQEECQRLTAARDQLADAQSKLTLTLDRAQTERDSFYKDNMLLVKHVKELETVLRAKDNELRTSEAEKQQAREALARAGSGAPRGASHAGVNATPTGRLPFYRISATPLTGNALDLSNASRSMSRPPPH